MIDTARILDLLVGGPQGSAPGTPAPSPFGSGTAPAPTGGGDLVARARGILGGVAGSMPQGLGGGVAGGVAAGAITSLLLGSKAGREFAGEALKLGAAAALGGLAWRAYSNYKAGQPPAASSIPGSLQPAPQAGSPVAAAAASSESAHALLLVRAMIASALSDGVLDDTERSTILGRLSAAGISTEEQRFLDAELARPLSPAQFAAAATAPEQRAEVYLASALAIDADTEAERAYLKYLAATLGLDDALIAHLEEAVRSAKGGPASLAAAS